MSAPAVLRRVCLRAYRLARRRIRRHAQVNVQRHPAPSPLAILRDELSLCAAVRVRSSEERVEEIAALSALVAAVDKEQARADIEGDTFR